MSLVSAPPYGLRSPTALRAPASQSRDITAKPIRKKMPDHLTAQAAPRQSPAAIRHGRSPSPGPWSLSGDDSYQ